MDALALLAQDHKKVKRLFRQAHNAKGIEKRKKIFRQIDSVLSLHTRMEEAIFYPEMGQYPDLKEWVDEALEAHEEIKALLGEIERLADSDAFDASLHELIENVENHIEEEEGELFVKVRELLDETALEKFGDRLESAKDEQLLEAG